jgi:hypothetical protein
MIDRDIFPPHTTNQSIPAMNQSARFGIVALSSLLLLAACKPSQPDNAQAAKPAADAPAAPAAMPAPGKDEPHMPPMPEMPKRDTTPVDTQVVDVTLSNQGDTEKNMIGAPTTTFGPQDTVYAEVQSKGTAKEYTIYAKWISADGSVLSDYGIKLNQAGDNRSVISLSKPDGWATGDNKIELAINGKTEKTVTFHVR